MSQATYLVGDVFDVLPTIPDDSVDLALTSPPFLGLRSYLPDDHPAKPWEIGHEPDPARFIATLLRLTAELRRVLAPHGSIAIELGDSYSGSGGSGGDYNPDRARAGQAQHAAPRPARNGRHLAHTTKDRYASSDDRPGWPLAKSLTLVPELYRIALAYGINPLTGRPSPAGRWRVRNVLRCKPNPMPGQVIDRYRTATTDIVIATPHRHRHFDLDAVRSTLTEPDRSFARSTLNRNAPGNHTEHDTELRPFQNPAGAPPLDFLVLPTEPYPGSHYATWPRRLCAPLIEAMAPDAVCTSCGALSLSNPHFGRADCDHAWRRGLVLDPFAGSGTTLAVATGMGRDAIGIDLDARNADLARERVGMFLTVHHAERTTA